MIPADGGSVNSRVLPCAREHRSCSIPTLNAHDRRTIMTTAGMVTRTVIGHTANERSVGARRAA